MRTSYNILEGFFCVQNSASCIANLQSIQADRIRKIQWRPLSKYRTSMWPSKPTHPLHSLQRTSEAEAIRVSLRPFSKKTVSWIKELKLLTTRTLALPENGGAVSILAQTSAAIEMATCSWRQGSSLLWTCYRVLFQLLFAWSARCKRCAVKEKRVMVTSITNW